MNEQQQTGTAGNAEGVLSDISLADYRANRDAGRDGFTAADERKPEAQEHKSDAGESSPGETAAEVEETDAAENESEHSAQDEADHSRPSKKKGGFQRTIERQKAEIERLKSQLAGNSAAGDELDDEEEAAFAPKQEAAVTHHAAKPKLDDFDSIEAFTDALTDWKLAQAEHIKTQQEAQAKAQSEAAKTISDWNSRKAEAQKAHADYDEVLESVDDVKLTPQHQRIFLESAHGPEIAYHLAQNKAELEKFAGLEPLAAARFLGQLEAQFASDSSDKPEPKSSKAPRPIRPLAAAKSAATLPLNVATASLADYRKAREAGRIR
jgi:hypothetical protein